MYCDLLIRNGKIFDDDIKSDSQDIAIRDGIILCNGKALNIEAEYVVDASGCYVVPGLVDFHTHLFQWGSDSGINGDIAFLPCGVTSAVDAGSAGVSNYEVFSRYCIASSVLQIKSFLNVSPAGLVMVRHHDERLDPSIFDSKKTQKLIQLHKDEILGLKIRLNRSIIGSLGLKPLKAAVDIAESIGVPVMVHPIDPPQDIDAIFDIMRSGDIFSHMYHKNGYGILDNNHKLKSIVFDARKKGIIFEVAAGRRHCSFEVARCALEEGFLPDIISTDETLASMFLPPLFSMTHLLSCFLNLGIPMRDLIRMASATPAKLMHIYPQGGTLQENTCADIAILKVLDNILTTFDDTQGGQFVGTKLIMPQMTIRKGGVVYRQAGF